MPSSPVALAGQEQHIWGLKNANREAVLAIWGGTEWCLPEIPMGFPY